MRRTILYYPSIVIPDGTWLKKSLLYWDEVSSIVPREVEYGVTHNDDLLQYLRDEGEYRPTYPDQLMDHEIFREFEEEIISKYRSYRNWRKWSNNQGRNPQTRSMNESDNSLYGIHREKMTHQLSRIIIRDKNHFFENEDEWFYMENVAANIYMSTLAKYLALANVNYTVIGTDEMRAIDKVYRIIQRSKKPNFGNLKPVLNVSINILPVPYPDTSYAEIIQFKRKYRDDLLSFRRILNNYEQQISKAEDEYEIREHTILFKEQMEKGTRETMKMLKGSGINFFLSSLRSIINIKSPTMLSTFAAFAGYKTETFPSAVAGALIGVAGTVDVAVNYMTIRNNTLEKLSDKGFLYLYHARKQGIITDFT